MSVSKACKSGACQTCTYTAAQCECSHHLHGSVLTTKADCLEAEATIQRFIAQQAGSAKTIEALAKLVWYGTQHCPDCRWAKSPFCSRCREWLDYLESLGFGERMREWAA